MNCNNLEEELISEVTSAMFGLPGKEEDRCGLNPKPRTLGIGWLLYGFVRATRPKVILEIGSGGSTYCLLWGIKHNEMGHLHICDIFNSGIPTAELLKEENGERMDHEKAICIRTIKKWEGEDITTIHHEDSRDLLSKWNTPLDMLMVDGDHGKELMENDIQFLNFLKPGGYGFFHDFYVSPGGVGATLRDLLKNNDEYSMMVEPTCFSMAIIQKKYSFDTLNAFAAARLALADNSNGAKTPIHITDPYACGAIKPWDGEWFPEDFHKLQVDGWVKGEKIMEYEQKTGTVVQSMQEWEELCLSVQ